MHTDPFLDKNGQVDPHSVAAMQTWTIGGIPQRVWLRGRRTDAPLLILVHGGPGSSESALFRAYVPDLEEHFVVVYWDQRGAGRSFTAESRRGEMTIDRFVEDLGELVGQATHRFGQQQVYLLAHSWGNVPALLYTVRHPETVAAYIAVSPAVDYPEAERLSWSWAASEARRRGEDRALAELNRIGPPPHSVEEMLVSRDWVDRFGGSFQADMNKGDLIFAALRTDEASLWDLVLFGAGNEFSLEALWPELRSYRAPPGARFEAPVYFLLGRHDRQVPAATAAAYFSGVEASCKQLIWFENSAHNPPFEEPERFVEVVRSVAASRSSGACEIDRPPS